MIELWYENRRKIIHEDIIRNSIRLMCKCAFIDKNNKLTGDFDAMINTGAHTSIIPKFIWNKCLVNLYDDTFLMGVKNNLLCSIPCYYGEVALVLLDYKENYLKPIKSLCYLSKTDEVPLIIGFHGCLEKFKLVSNFPENKAYLEQV